MGFGGAALKFGSTALYALEFCCAAIILGIYSYFLSVEADRNVNIPVWQQAVTGLAGATVLYTIFAVLLTCFLGGKVRIFLSTYAHPQLLTIFVENLCFPRHTP
jgi:biotin transporter BioY